MLRTLFVAAVAAATLGGCETAQSADSASVADRDCFRTLDVHGYSVLDDRRVRVHITPQREYFLTMNRNVRDLDWTHAILIRSRTSFICVGNGLGVELVVGEPPFPYPVNNIERAPQTAPEGS